MILLLIINAIGYSQTLSITNAQRDSIVSKILRGNEAIAENITLLNQLQLKDSIVKLQTSVIGVLQLDVQKLNTITTNNKLIISNQKTMISNEKNVAGKKGFTVF
ncbi:Uncharacterised protein [Candidatus Venteria ishoeyi]|uniref:Uncharacterized protein n=1 Tax=Candidatus Venteria ishoeyi TaxID=1899563 RepID=A0A1H6F540_9GAMM|nr:Uncharacterised protein [Candidatus Venteria ishoeyi]